MVYGSKRGLSAIVATLIVVLLAIVAFGIISGFIQDIVTGKTQQAELASSDTRLDVQKASVDGNMSSVSVRREGSDSLEVVGARVVFDSGDGRAVVSSNFSIGKQELDTFSIPLCSEEFSDVDFSSEDLSATVYPIVMYEDERTMLDGNPSSVDFVEVEAPKLVENCNNSQSSESGSGGNSSKSEDSSEGDSGDNSDSRSENGLSSDGSEDDSSSEDGGGICVDKDQDNYINKSSSSAFICNSFAGYDGNDCNDSNLDVHEGHQEICGDNVDNDCDGQVDENCGQQAPASGGNFDLMKRESQTFFRSGSGINSKSDNITLENTGSQEIYISGSVRGPAAEYITISQKSQISEPGVSYFTYTVQRPDTIGGPITGTLVLSTRSTQKEVSLVIGAR